MENRSFLTKQKGEKEIISLPNSHLFILKWSSICLKDSSLNAFLPDIVYELRRKIDIKQSYWANTVFLEMWLLVKGNIFIFILASLPILRRRSDRKALSWAFMIMPSADIFITLGKWAGQEAIYQVKSNHLRVLLCYVKYIKHTNL